MPYHSWAEARCAMQKKVRFSAGICLRIFLLAVASMLFADNQALADNAEKWAPSISFEGKLGNKRTINEFNLQLPILQTNDSMFFLDVRAQWDNKSSQEGNFGLGYRRIIDQEYIVGGYGFFDRRWSLNDKKYTQAVVGLELLTEDWDFRVNGYQPLGDRSHTISVGTGSSQSNDVIKNGAGLSLVTRSYDNAAIITEEAMSGVDGEIGYRLPISKRDGGLDLRVFAGAFSFRGDDAATVQGPRIRLQAEIDGGALEFLPSGSKLTVGGVWQYDKVRDRQRFAVVRLTIPLQSSKTSKSSSLLRGISRRMTTPIVRDVDIVTATTTPKNISVLREQSQPEAVQVADASGAIVDVASVTFVDSGDNLEDAIANDSNGIVVVSGRHQLSQQLVLKDNQALIGSGAAFVGKTSGKTGHLKLDQVTTIIGAVQNKHLIRMSHGSVISGGSIINTHDSIIAGGIEVNNVQNVRIANVDVHTKGSHATGIIVRNGAKDVVIKDVTVTTKGRRARGLLVVDKAENVLLTGTNTFSVQGEYGLPIFYSGGVKNFHVDGTYKLFEGYTLTGTVNSDEDEPYDDGDDTDGVGRTSFTVDPGDRKNLLVRGEIYGDFAYRLVEAVEASPGIENLLLGPMNGSEDDIANYAAGVWVRNQGINTHAVGPLASGGVDFFLAGDKRTKDMNGSFWVHPWSMGPETTANDLPRTHLIHINNDNYVKEMLGANSAFYDFTLGKKSDGTSAWEPDGDDGHTLTEAEIVQYKVLMGLD